MVVKVVLELGIRHLVAILEHTIRLRVLLYRIIRQVHVLIVRVVRVDGELRRGRPQVALGEEIQRVVIVKEHPDPYIELSLIYQKRLLNVLLQYKRVVLDLILRRNLLRFLRLL